MDTALHSNRNKEVMLVNSQIHTVRILLELCVSMQTEVQNVHASEFGQLTPCQIIVRK